MRKQLPDKTISMQMIQRHFMTWISPKNLLNILAGYLVSIALLRSIKIHLTLPFCNRMIVKAVRVASSVVSFPAHRSFLPMAEAQITRARVYAVGSRLPREVVSHVWTFVYSLDYVVCVFGFCYICKGKLYTINDLKYQNF